MRVFFLVLILNLFSYSIYAQQSLYDQIQEYVQDKKGEVPVKLSDDIDKIIHSRYTKRVPLIDGVVDNVWKRAKELVGWDPLAKRNVYIKSLYSDDKIFFLVRYADLDKNTNHKSWLWNSQEDMYVEGPDREDSFVFKWSMQGNDVDLSIYADNPYKADIWFWKAARTNPYSYADDKLHILTNQKIKKTTQVVSRSGKTNHLLRIADNGKSVYKSIYPVDYKGDRLLKYDFQKPTASRADVSAKGIWENNSWVIEFSRDLITGNDDDVEFDTSKNYLFGFSLYEIAAKTLGLKTDLPLYGCGDVYNKIILKFS